MESILASFFRQHQEQEAWWYKVKIAPNVASASAEVTNLKPELWEVLFECDLARKRGKNNIINRKRVDEFITDNGLTDVLECGEADKSLVIRIGVYSAKT